MKTRQAPLHTPTYAHSLWRKGCHLSVPLGTLISKDTTSESTPGHTVREHRPGASPTTKGHDRLVHSVEATSDTRPAPPCPLCGTPATGASERPLSPSIRIGDYRCAAGHIWTTRWLVAA